MTEAHCLAFDSKLLRHEQSSALHFAIFNTFTSKTCFCFFIHRIIHVLLYYIYWFTISFIHMCTMIYIYTLDIQHDCSWRERCFARQRYDKQGTQIQLSPKNSWRVWGGSKAVRKACGGGHNTKRESLFKNASQKTCGRHERHARHDRHDAVDEALKHKDQRWSEIAKDRGRATKAKHDVQIEAMRHTWCKWECKNTKGLCNLWITDKDAVSRLWIAINFEFVLFENPTRTGGCALCSQL